MANTTEPIMKATSIGATSADAARLREIGNLRGMRLYRVVTLLLIGWDMLTEEQQHDAHKRLFARNRGEPVSAA